jgi:hypothetical protein
MGDVEEAVLEIRYRRIKVLPPIGKTLLERSAAALWGGFLCVFG